MRTIKQSRTDGNCMAACAAMLTNTTIQDFIDTIGQAHVKCGNSKDKILGYSDADMQKYLILHDKIFDTMHIRKNNIDLRKKSVIVKREYNYKTLDAFLTVESQRVKDVLHAVVWDSKAQCIRDPNPFVPARRKLSDYVIKFWTPVYNVL